MGSSGLSPAPPTPGVPGARSRRSLGVPPDQGREPPAADAPAGQRGAISPEPVDASLTGDPWQAAAQHGRARVQAAEEDPLVPVKIGGPLIGRRSLKPRPIKGVWDKEVVAFELFWIDAPE